MKLNINRFSESFTMNTEAIQDIINQLIQIGDSCVDELTEIVSIVSEINGTELLGSATETINQILAAINTFTGEKFSPAFTGLSNALTTVVAMVSDLETDYGSMISGWAEDMKSAMNMVNEGLNSTVEKGSYSGGQYITDMSNSGRAIVKETATMIKNTGDYFKSLTGKSVVESAVGAFNNIISFASNGGGHFMNLISGIMR